MKKSRREDPLTTPIPFHTGSNGEFVPRPKTARDRLAERTFWREVEDRSRRVGMSRRQFSSSVLGTATALGVINQVYGCDGEGDAGGSYGVGGDMMMDPDACEPLTGDEFIFDVQTHHVNPQGAWRDSNPGMEIFLNSLAQASCGESDTIECYNTDHYIREMFINSDTTMAVLSSLPASAEDNPLDTPEMRDVANLINLLADSQRAVIHGQVLPEQGATQIEGMERLHSEHDIAAWKVYTPFNGWRLDDPAVGIPFIEKGLELGVNIVCCHKGLALPGFDPAFSDPVDVGIVAAAYPDMNFVVYHSAYELGITEGPYDVTSTVGVDTLIRAFEENGIAKNTGNVYAELGSTWKILMTAPEQAAHALGKLLLHIGEDRIVWGTDSIWYGTPQDQIAAFRAFEISTELQETYGYPALTPEIKAKIFGLNSAKLYGIDVEAQRCAISEDDIAKEKMALMHEPRLAAPKLRAYGPQTRREFFRFLDFNGGKPG